MPKLALFRSSSKQDGFPSFRERIGQRCIVETEIEDGLLIVRFQDGQLGYAFPDELDYEGVWE